MPAQGPLRLIKRCRLYLEKETCKDDTIPHLTRGLYVLYQQLRSKKKKKFHVCYIGVAGVSATGESGIRGRLRSHTKSKKLPPWTHYSFFEVHDNISRQEILELEGLLLRIFRHDNRIKLGNAQLGSKVLKRLSSPRNPVWKSELRSAK